MYDWTSRNFELDEGTGRRSPDAVRRPRARGTERRFFTRVARFFGLLCGLALTAGADGAGAITWPTSWNPIGTCGESEPIDTNPSVVDLVGSAGNNAAFLQIDSQYLYLRERVDVDPSGPGGFASQSWVVLIQIPTGSAFQYQYMVTLDGGAEEVQLWSNAPGTASSIAFSPIFNDPAETMVFSDSTATLARIVAAGSSIGGTADYFVDFAMPLSTLAANGIDPNVSLYWYATSANSNNYNKDTLNCPFSPTTDLALTKSVSPSPIGADPETVTYTITATNTGTYLARGTVITDTDFPSWITVTNVTSTSGTVTFTSSSFEVRVADLSIGASVTVTVTATADAPGAPASFTNTVHAFATNAANTSASATLNVTAPTATPTSSPTSTATSTPTQTPTSTVTHTPSSTPTLTSTPTQTGTPTATLANSPTSSPTETPSPTSTPTDTDTPTPTPTETATTSPTETPTSMPSPTHTPTLTSTATPTTTPTETPTTSQTSTPSLTETPVPTDTPTPTQTPEATVTETAPPPSTYTPADTATATEAPTVTSTPSDTPSPTSTSTATDTPTAEPTVVIFEACGNGIIQPGEECDDGNLFDGDCCSSTCQLEAPTCTLLPPACASVPNVSHFIDNPTFRISLLRDGPPRDGVVDRWRARGEFFLPDGVLVDPANELVHFILNQNEGTEQSRELYHPILDPPNCPGNQCFATRADAQGVLKSWMFRRRLGEADVAAAPGWRTAWIRRPSPRVRLGSVYRFIVKGSGASILEPELGMGIRRVRQSIVIGDVCITRLLDCTKRSTPARAQFVCRPAHCGNGQITPGEQCGEASLPACPGGKVCDTCRCVNP